MMLLYFAIFVYPWTLVGRVLASEQKGGNRNAEMETFRQPCFIVYGLVTGGSAMMYHVGGLEFIHGGICERNPSLHLLIHFWILAMGVAEILRWD